MEQKNKFTFIFGVLIFTIGCVLGYIIETVFYILKYGYYVNKQGLLFGPFKPIYGLGCLLITIIYYLLKNKSITNIFAWGVVSGTIFEYIASLFIEKVFHSYIWSYSNFKYNLNGRIYLPYCIIWGLISVLWSKLLLPNIIKIVDRFSTKKLYKLLGVILSIFMILNVLLTGVVLLRQGYRNKNNKLFNIVDHFYTEEEILKKFPKFRSLK